MIQGVTFFHIQNGTSSLPTVEMEECLDHLLPLSLRCLLGKHSSICQVFTIPFYFYLTAALSIERTFWASFTTKDCKSELRETEPENSIVSLWKSRGLEEECPRFSNEILQIQQFSSISNLWGLLGNWRTASSLVPKSKENFLLNSFDDQHTGVKYEIWLSLS